MKTFEEFTKELDEKIRMKPEKFAERRLAAWKVTYDVYADTFKPEERDKAQAKFDEVSKKFKNAQMYAIDQAGITIKKNVLGKLLKNKE